MLSAVLSYSWHNADETWQSVEVAHKLVFGRGYLTWEWTNEAIGPIRSYIHPLIFVPILYLLKVTHLDYYWIVALAPRIQQGIITAIGDYYMVKFYDINFERIGRKWFILLHSTNVYLLYCGSRTLINTLELNLTCLALYNYSKTIIAINKPEEKRTPEEKRVALLNQIVYVLIISASFVIRPTTAIFWLPLVFYHVLLIYKQKQIFWTLVMRLIPSAFVTLIMLGGIDSMMYGKLVFIPWNFFRINFMYNIGSQYGVEPWYYYFTHTFLPLLNISCLMALKGITITQSRENPNKIYLASIVFTIILLSLIPHKEQRFLLPLFPLILCYGAQYLDQFNGRMYDKRILAVFISILNLVPLIYLLFAHKVGATNVVSYLAKELETNKTGAFNQTNILFLLPCHSTPFYSHFHLDYRLDFLKCPPVIDSNWEDYAEGKDESDFFFDFPQKWIEINFAAESRNTPSKLPSHIVIFNKQADLEILKTFFTDNNYVKCMDIFNTLISENNRHGTRIYVYCRQM